MPNELWTTAEVAKYLKRGRHYIGLIRDAGLLKGIKLGRGYLYDSEDVKAFVELAKEYDLSNKEKVILAGIAHRKEKSASFCTPSA